MTSTKRQSKKQRAAERRRKARRKALMMRVGGVAAAVLFVAIAVFAFSSGEQAEGNTETEAWDLPALEGEERIALHQFSGKPTVAAFFASWCEICQRELPGFAQLANIVGDEVSFVGINTMNNGSGLAFAQDRGIGHWPLARDIGLGDGRQLATNFGARGSPTTVIYDESGAVVDVTLGRLTAQDLAVKLNQFFGVGG